MPAAIAPSSSSIFPPQLRATAPYYFLLLAVFTFYSGIYDNAFLYDDVYLIVQNTFLRSWNSIGPIFHSYVNGGAFRAGHFYRPLQNILYLIVYQSAGLSPFAFHFLNIALHAANAMLLYAIGRKLGFFFWSSFLAALIWALHPVQTEAVTYMSGTGDVLYSFFCLLGVLVVVPDFTRRNILFAIPLFVLGLLSKETAIVFPALVMSCIYLKNRNRLSWKPYLATWPLWCVALGYIGLRMSFAPFGGTELLNVDPNSKLYGAHILLRIYTFLATLPSYAKLLLWPTGLHMDRDFPLYLQIMPEVIMGFLLLLLAAGQVLVWGRGRKAIPFSWGLFWFAAAYFPETGVFVPVNSLFLEHWMYLPTAGFFLGAAETVTLASQNPKVGRSLAIAACFLGLFLGFLTYQQNKVWSDPVTFYRNILDHGETSFRARNNLGVAYMESGQYEKALEQFELVVQNHDLTPEAHQNIASLLSKLPDGQSHIAAEKAELQKALSINPDFLSAYDGLADIYTFEGDKNAAAYYRQRADDIRKKRRPQ